MFRSLSLHLLVSCPILSDFTTQFLDISKCGKYLKDNCDPKCFLELTSLVECHHTLTLQKSKKKNSASSKKYFPSCPMNLHWLTTEHINLARSDMKKLLLRQVKMTKAQKIQFCRKPSIPLLMEPPINYKYKTSLQSEIFIMQ